MTVSWLPFFKSLEIVDESTDAGTCSPGLFVNLFEFIERYVFFIQANIGFALDLTARSLCGYQKPDELRIRLEIASL
ncbi:MAG: hypothetical protein COW41_01095 [Deltaproteobacteria bacterium CG17_big_fil_post_rev_8_21_14_2_50_51_6]|nr:MAG: hypothetical protein COW41_01095 [Deltaproteobacteria bacterium CG17_big_fil_post_rev_8_21_14_2_50_51_6]